MNKNHYFKQSLFSLLTFAILALLPLSISAQDKSGTPSSDFYISVGVSLSNLSRTGDLSDKFDEDDKDDGDSDDFDERSDRSVTERSAWKGGRGMGGDLNLGFDYFFAQLGSAKLGAYVALNFYGGTYYGINKSDNYKFRVTESLTTASIGPSVMIALDDAKFWKLGGSVGFGNTNYSYKSKYEKILDNNTSNFMDTPNRETKPEGKSSGTVSEAQLFIDAFGSAHGARLGLRYLNANLGDVKYAGENLSIGFKGFSLYIHYRYGF